MRSAFLAEVANWCGAALASELDASRVISDVAALDQAGSGDLTFLDNSRYLYAFRSTRAAAVLVAPRHVDATPSTCAALITREPYRAMAMVMAKLYPGAVRPGSVFSETGVSCRVRPSVGTTSPFSIPSPSSAA